MERNPILIAKELIAYHLGEAARLEQWVQMGEELLSGPRPVGSLPQGGMPNAPLSGATLTQAPKASEPPEIASEDAHSTAEILAAAEAVLLENGKAMVAADIYDELVRRGIKIAGKKPKANLTAKFSTKRDVFQLDQQTGKWSHGYWARGRPAFNPAPLGRIPDIFADHALSTSEVLPDVI